MMPEVGRLRRHAAGASADVWPRGRQLPGHGRWRPHGVVRRARALSTLGEDGLRDGFGERSSGGGGGRHAGGEWAPGARGTAARRKLLNDSSSATSAALCAQAKRGANGRRMSGRGAQHGAEVVASDARRRPERARRREELSDSGWCACGVRAPLANSSGSVGGWRRRRRASGRRTRGPGGTGRQWAVDRRHWLATSWGTGMRVCNRGAASGLVPSCCPEVLQHRQASRGPSLTAGRIGARVY